MQWSSKSMKIGRISVLILLLCVTVIVCSQDAVRLDIAKRIQSLMNEDVDPCQDFYKFTCDNWQNINPILLHTMGPISDLDNVLQRRVDYRSQEILKAGADPKDTILEKNVRYLYDTCVNLHTPEVYDTYKVKLSEIAKEFGDMPVLNGDEWDENNFDWIEASAKILKKYGIPTVLNAGIYNNTLFIGGVRLTIPFTLSQYDYLQSSLQENLNVDAHLAEQAAKEVCNFTKLLEMKLPLQNYVPTTVDKMHQKYAPIIDIKKFVNIILGDATNKPIYEANEEYLRNLMELIQRTPKRTVANYILYILLNSFQITPHPVLENHKSSCAYIVQYHFQKQMDGVVYRKYDSNEMEFFLNSTFNQLKDVIKAQLLSHKHEWISQNTEKLIINKLKEIQLHFNSEQLDGLEEYSLPVDRKHYLENWKTQVIYNAKVQNEFLRSGVIANKHRTIEMNNTDRRLNYPLLWLQPYYLWATEAPHATKFGSLGALIAREIINGLDVDVWDESTKKALEEREKCFKERNANIEDILGIEMAYEAYIRWYDKAEDNSLETFPDFSYNHKQLFFIGYAQSFCNVQYDNGVYVSHTSRVNGKVSNSEQFAKAFNCPVGSKMNPKEKCEIASK